MCLSIGGGRGGCSLIIKKQFGELRVLGLECKAVMVISNRAIQKEAAEYHAEADRFEADSRGQCGPYLPCSLL